MKLKTFTLTFAVTSAILNVLAPIVSAHVIIKAEGEGALLLKRGSSDYSQIGVGEELAQGDRLLPADGMTVKVLCDDLTVWRVAAGVPSGVNSGCPGDGPHLLTVRGDVSHRPGGSDSRIPYILSPRMTYWLDDRPTFRWNGVKGASRYTVRLLGPGTTDWKTEVSSTQVVYPDKAPRLEQGVKYLLVVEADNGASSLEDSGACLGFELLEDYEVDEVQEGKAKIAQSPDLTEEEKALAIAQLYTNNDLSSDAIDALETLAKKKLEIPLVYRMLGDLYAEAGLNLLAQARYTTALERSKAIRDRYGLTEAQAQLANVKLMLGKITEARHLFEQAHAGYRVLDNLERASRVERRLAELAETKSEVALTDRTGGCTADHILTPRD